MTGTERLLVAISLAFGLLYLLLWNGTLPPVTLIALKGAGVGFLALAAALSARSTDGWLLAGLLALGATGDVLIELSLGAGAAAFAAAHLVSIALYLRNRRRDSGPLDKAGAALLLAAAAILPALLLWGRPEAVAFVAYALLLGAMAASAWLSRFPRLLVAAGACLFLASDMLIAARLGLDSRPEAFGHAIWLLYYLGQMLIFLGVSRSLRASARP